MYVYIETEPGLYTVGFYDPTGKWYPESDHETVDDAAKRCAQLNGGFVPQVSPDNPSDEAFFVEKFVLTQTRLELDLDFPFRNADGTENEVMLTNKAMWATVPAIAIDEVMSILTDLKTIGADRVYIATHEHHKGYYFTGVALKRV